MPVAGASPAIRPLGLVRLSSWWSYKTPHILAMAYIACIGAGTGPGAQAARLALFALWIAATAGAAYALNDLCDEARDRAAGKERDAARLSRPGRAALLLFLALCSLAPWFFLRPGPGLCCLLLLEYGLLVFYSARPLRLKEKTWAGPLADATAGHLLPAAIAFLVFGGPEGAKTPAWAFFSVLCLWQLLKGLRNILLHQLDDRKADQKAGAGTFVLVQGPLFTLNLLNRALLPAEILFLALFCALLVPLSPAFILGLICFFLVSGLSFSIWKVFFIPRRQFRIKFLYFLNDFYEIWFPLLALAVLTTRSAAWGLVLAVHLALFPRFWGYGRQTLEAVIANIRDERENPTGPYVP